MGIEQVHLKENMDNFDKRIEAYIVRITDLCCVDDVVLCCFDKIFRVMLAWRPNAMPTTLPCLKDAGS
jgi:hypothetical protein